MPRLYSLFLCLSIDFLLRRKRHGAADSLRDNSGDAPIGYREYGLGESGSRLPDALECGLRFEVARGTRRQGGKEGNRPDNESGNKPGHAAEVA